MRARFSYRTINCLQWFIMYFCRIIAVFWRLYIQHIQINIVVFCTLTILSKFTTKMIQFVRTCLSVYCGIHGFRVESQTL